MAATADRLTSQLVNVADIVGDLGLNVGMAQKELNASYIKSLIELVRIIKDIGDITDKQAAVETLKALAPPRYQYTETVLDFSADLAESKRRTTQAGISANFSAVSVNAAMTLGYGHDYRASARITTTLHAYHDPTMAEKLLARAQAIRTATQTLPEPLEIDVAINKDALTLIKALGEGPDAPPAPTDPV